MIRFLFLLFCLLSTVATAQTGLTGTVTSGGKAIPNAVIRVSESARGTSTDENGHFTLLHNPGKYTLLISAIGYKPEKQAIQLIKGSLRSASFVLTEETRQLNEVIVSGQQTDGNGLRRLADVENMAIYAGKKNEVILPAQLDANLAANVSRQIYAKVPGVHIIENDAAGIQLGIATRGLNPNRTSEFNTRQNGYDLSADPVGYPESYYTPPTEAVERIEIVRGAASLQYGTQFGGLLNFVMKEPVNQPFSLQTRQTAGSFGLFNSFNSVSGTTGKFGYYGALNYRRGDGWRENTGFHVTTGYAALRYQLTKAIRLGIDMTAMGYDMQQPGGLTDAQFEQNPRQSLRSRNWFQARWNLPAVHLTWQVGDRTRLNVRGYGLLAGRGSIGNILNVLKDKTDSTRRRQLTYDHYRNVGIETRVLHRYALFGQRASLLAGIRYFQGRTHRQQGSGADGNGNDFGFPTPPDEFDYRFRSDNLALFAENVVWIGERTSVTPGIRMEWIGSTATGVSYDPVTKQYYPANQESNRQFPIVGLGVSHLLTADQELYFNFSQNYSPVNYGDIFVRTPNYQVDPHLKDVTGFNADLGLRGKWGSRIRFDLSAYWLDYNNRIGLIRIASEDGTEVIRYRTNVGHSRSLGAEGFVEVSLTRPDSASLQVSWFGSLAYIDARYISAINPLLQTLLVDRRVEYAPRVIARSGLTIRHGRWSATLQGAFTSEQYTDAYNSPATADGLVGPIPSYFLVDFSASYRLTHWFFGLNINNLTNQHYFTRRALGFPGPGIIPSDPRNGSVTVGWKW